MKWKWLDLFGGGSVEVPRSEPLWRGTPTTVTNNATTTMRLVEADRKPKVEVVLTSINGDVVIALNLQALDDMLASLRKMRGLLLSATEPSDQVDETGGPCN